MNLSVVKSDVIKRSSSYFQEENINKNNPNDDDTDTTDTDTTDTCLPW
jgi:hypothetical protein